MKYSVLDMIVAESDYNTMRLNHFMQCNIDTFAYESASIMEDMNSGIITEADASVLYEGVFANIASKITEFIQKIIDAIAKFFSELKIKIFGSKEEKEKLKKLKAAAANSKSLKGKSFTKKIKIFKIKRNKKALDTYIKEMASLERQMMKLKYQAAQDDGSSREASKVPVVGKLAVSNTTASTLIEYNELQKKIDECNRKYDRVVSGNAEIVELALNDAIRFSDKDLNSIELDLEAIKSDSDKVLAKFKTDANGVKTKQQANLIQKAVQSIETRVRKTMKDGAEFQTKNSNALVSFFTAAGIISTGKLALKGYEALTGKNPVKDVSDAARETMSDIAKDPVGASERMTAPIAGPLERRKHKDFNKGAATNVEMNKDKLDTGLKKAKTTLTSLFVHWVAAGFPKNCPISGSNLKVLTDYYIKPGHLKYAYQAPYAFNNPPETIMLASYSGNANWPNITNHMKFFIKKNKDFKFDLDSVLDSKGVSDINGLKKFMDAYVQYASGQSAASMRSDLLADIKAFKSEHTPKEESK